MTPQALQHILANGEDTRHQFKRGFAHADSLAAELVAFANGLGGVLLIGVNDDASVHGLSSADVARLNQMLSNAASQHVNPAINPVSTNVRTNDGLVMVVEVQPGLNKPYMDQQGRIWVKSGADKRQVTAREEMQRLFQQSGLLHADEIPVAHATLDDLDLALFSDYFTRRYQRSPAAVSPSMPQLLRNLGLMHADTPNLAAILLFGKVPELRLPAFTIKAVAFPGTIAHDLSYIDSENLEGTLLQQYQKAMAFLRRNLHHVQSGTSFNSPSQLEIPALVFEEILVNALVHRDYFTQAHIQLFIFSDRVEITSPGHLPDHGDVTQLRYGVSRLRNPVLAGHAFHLLPYHGLGTGIPRATEAWPQIELQNHRTANHFKAVVWRPLTSHAHAQEVKAESKVESKVESLDVRVLDALQNGALSKAGLAQALGMRQATGQLHQQVRDLLAHEQIEMTLPEKPNSRLQQYRLTKTGRQWLAATRKPTA